MISVLAVLALFAFSMGWRTRAEDDTNAVPTMGQTNADKNVDNSQINQRDRNGQTETPLQQGNSREDIRLARKIRKSVVNETNNFSILAHNIKIIARDGKVTLRGPVASEEEKSSIETIAQNLAGTNNVNNLLEVKNNQ